MRINRLSFKNFGSYGNNLTVVEFPKQCHLFLITGENGHGKSFIEDAVNFALFGNPFRKIKKSELQNRINGKGLYTKIEVSSNNAEWIIERTLKDIKIFKNDEEINLDAHVVDIQKYIDSNIIGASENLYRTTNLVSMRGFQSFFNLPKEKRRVVFENMIGIQLLSNMKKLVASKLNGIVADKSALERERTILSENITTHKSNLSKLIEMDSITNNDIGEMQNEISKIRKEKETLEDIKKDAPTEKELKTAEKETLKEINECKVSIRSLQSQINELNDDVDFFEHADCCPRCKKSLSVAEKESELSRIETELAIKEADLSELEKSLVKKERKLNQICEDENTLKELIDSIDNNSKEISKIEAKIESIQSYKNDNSFKSDIENQIKDYEKRLDNTLEELESMNDFTDILNSFKIILGDDGIKRYVYSKFLPILNNNINKILRVFEFNIRFELLETLEEVLYNNVGEEISINSLSNGEQQLVDVSFMFGVQNFLQQINKYNGDICFIDELFDASLDSNNLDKILNFLRQSNGQIIIISHKKEMKDSFDYYFRVVKENGFSKIITE